MINMIKWIRGALGLTAMWGAVWGAIFAALSVAIGLVDPDSIDPGEGPGRVAWLGAVFGMVSGATFGLVFSLAERHNAIRDLSVLRAGIWGALATAVFPLLTAVDNSMLIVLCPIGAALAATSVAVAKRAELRASLGQPKLPRTES